MAYHIHKITQKVLLLIITVLIFSTLPLAEKPKGKGPVRTLSKATVLDFHDFDVNRILSYTSNVGELVSARNNGGNSAMWWPAGSPNTINYQSGLWIGGMVGGEVRTAAAEYVTEFVPGTYEDWTNQDDPSYRVYEITRADFLDPTPPIDFVEWPFDDGAPALLAVDGTDSLDGNGNKIPYLLGDNTYWSVYNDADPTAHAEPFGTAPLGVEVQQTLWGYNRADAFGDMMFIKYWIINKGGNTIDDAYLTFWADIDLGDSNDDLAASDIDKNFAYVYNYGADSQYGIRAPAIGYDFFQGPVVPSAGDNAKVSKHLRNTGIMPGYRNLPMTSFNTFVRGAPPGLGDPATAAEMYNFQQGLNGLGEPIINPVTNQVSTYMFSGDPVAGTGWLMQDETDMRIMLTAGPFTMAPGDTQELVGGIIIAQGTDALNSVTKLRWADNSAQTAYDSDFEVIEYVSVDKKDTELPSSYILNTNYPNPFNPATTIKYSLPISGEIRLIIYNLLGEEIARLADGEQSVGEHSVKWDASNYASGIYFYRLQSGNFTQTKKMVLSK